MTRGLRRGPNGDPQGPTSGDPGGAESARLRLSALLT